ncbi:hypothetical protein PC129_g13468 [Phytophthora cactorum]|uniref:Uncharacterized protein n=1 Tax=Phytophthora cactorum TaxID=29920 RepID=A0A8T1LG10_9STRA|nr:hypothetical protein Pcac1_g23790 [Phytophthora cactorum]KAG3080319.1 hypothetical protein PI125_g20474 [Phytophthora idaei]KAG2921638.1 hypothetical protein PC117_g16161 [Phytophthora cactorum]KAG2926762.1 hypothetical protein PC114_g3684 [Phytophthora cactorum]KAG3032839.1 hypothetical protein PC120_g2249 [Phytophthora cactorum]
MAYHVGASAVKRKQSWHQVCCKIDEKGPAQNVIIVVF